MKKQDRYINSASGGEGLVQQPFVVEKLSVMIAELNGLKCFPESFDTFKKKWEPSAQRKATGSGRATKAIDDKEGLQRHIISRFECVLESNQQLLARAAAQPNFKQRLQEAMFFAFSKDMRSCGPEYNLLGSMKLTFSGGRHVTNTHTNKTNTQRKIIETIKTGSRRVIIAAFDVVKKAVANFSPEGTVVSLSLARDFLSCAGALHATALSKFGDIWHATVGPETILYVPAGFLVAEQTINGEDIYGLRCMVPPPQDGTSRRAWDSMMRSIRPGGVGTPVPPSYMFAGEIEDAINGGVAKSES